MASPSSTSRCASLVCSALSLRGRATQPKDLYPAILLHFILTNGSAVLNDEEIEAVARDHVSKTYPADCEILYREKRLKPGGTYFVANRRTDDPLEVYVGCGGFFVNRESGEIWEFGSGQIVHEGLDYWLQWYAEGWRPGMCRLTVRDVNHPHRFAQLLVEHHLSYRMRELEHNIVWSRVVEYDEALVLRRIDELPCTFMVTADQLRALIPVLQTEGGAVFDYSHVGAPRKYDWHPENNTTDQLGPQYE